MKALSLWQPWASALVADQTVLGDALRPKTIETRTWSTSYRGPLLICSAKRWDQTMARWSASELGFLGGWANPHPDAHMIPDDLAYLKFVDLEGATHWQLPLGFALGVVDLVKCVPTESLRGQIPEWEYSLGNYAPGRFAWITDNLRRFHIPRRITGRQGLFDVPDAKVASFFEKDVEPRSTAVQACARCGCTWERACPGGCCWVLGLKDVCSACASPSELARHQELAAP